MFRPEETNVDAGRHTSNSQSIEFGPWHISYDVSRILPSMCATKVVCERDDDQFCQFCTYSKELKIPHFPDMVFPKNRLTLAHKSGASINFNPLDALKRVASTVEPVEVSCSEVWMQARPYAEKLKKSFDWTFCTDYKGSISDNITVWETEESIDFELLKQKNQILFYHDLTLFEDELHDHGVSKLSVKIRVMPSYWFVLLRYFLRVDDVLVRSNETRMFHMLNTDYILREYTSKESSAKDLNMPTSHMKEADDVIPFLPVKEKITHKLHFNCSS
ncbi:TIP41-like protein isoform X2 [Bombyx mandarina]|uniref:TIP41-like protein n=2 Tax=Bombyx TaxID=7090 RepID=A0A8R2M0A0_BOMMO|nr:TIP41-like protein isoform X2 [Bombyx mandarina]XP_037870946.1 TIP41-like protein isoform X2 [Bombyx mori]